MKNKIKPVFYGEVMDGKVKLENKQALVSYLQTWKGKFYITISKIKKPRSEPENRYYWGVIIEILADYIGDRPDVIHEWLKSLFLKVIEYKETKGKTLRLERIKSTTELSTVEAERYYEEIRIWAATTLGVSIPEPNEVEIEDNLQTFLT